MNTWATRTATRPARRPRRGSVLVVSVLLVTIAGLAVLSWLGFINESARQAARARSQTHAFYAAESGVERVVDYFNNPGDFVDLPPDTYLEYETHPSNYFLAFPVQPATYGMLDPYIMDYAKDGDGKPVNSAGATIWDDAGSRVTNRDELIVTRYTYFRNLGAGTPAAISQTSKVVSTSLDVRSDTTLVMRDATGVEQARVVSIQLIHPSELEAAELATATAERPIVCKVIAVGESRGVRVTVETMLSELQSPFFHSPAAIISESAVEFSGGFNVYWGEVWARNDIELSSDIMTKIPRYDPDEPFRIKPGESLQGSDFDPWFRLRTEGLLRRGGEYANGLEYDGFSAAPVAKLTNEEVFYTPYDADYLPKIRGKVNPEFENLENLKQNQSLKFPHYDYTQWREFFMQYQLPYYWTDQAGNIYGRDDDPDSMTYGQVVTKSYDAWFNVDPASEDYNAYREQFAFIDSVPVDDAGNPAPIVNGAPVINETYYPRRPDDSRAIIPTISASGNSTHTRGVFLCAANIDMTGQGNPPASDELIDADGNPIVLMPDGTEPPNRNPLPFKVFHNGLLYSWGQIANGGNRTFYGSVYAVGGFSGSGAPAVFYNVRMKDGSWLNIDQSRVRRQMWSVSRGDSGGTGGGAEDGGVGAP